MTREDLILKYAKENYDTLGKVIVSDFLEPIDLLIKNKHNVSALKLMISAIDSLAFLEYGDVIKNFQDFVDNFCDKEALKALNVTSSEIWELRNGLIHTTRESSRATNSSRVNRIVLFINNEDENLNTDSNKSMVHIIQLINTLMTCVKNWVVYKDLDHYNNGSIVAFIEDYNKNTVTDFKINVGIISV